MDPAREGTIRTAPAGAFRQTDASCPHGRCACARPVKTLLYGSGACVGYLQWNAASLSVRSMTQLILRGIGGHRRHCTDHLMSYARAHNKAQYERATPIRKRHPLLAGGVASYNTARRLPIHLFSGQCPAARTRDHARGGIIGPNV